MYLNHGGSFPILLTQPEKKHNFIINSRLSTVATDINWMTTAEVETTTVAYILNLHELYFLLCFCSHESTRPVFEDYRTVAFPLLFFSGDFSQLFTLNKSAKSAFLKSIVKIQSSWKRSRTHSVWEGTLFNNLDYGLLCWYLIDLIIKVTLWFLKLSNYLKY